MMKSAGLLSLMFLFNMSVSSQIQTISLPVLKISFDTENSPFMGADNVSAFRAGLNFVDDSLMNDSLCEIKATQNNFKGFAYRMAKLYLIDLNVASLSGLMQHEFFGHCWAYRQAGYEFNSIQISPLPPFGIGTGTAHRGDLIQIFDSAGNQLAGYDLPETSEEVLISMAGVKSQQILSECIAEKFFQQGCIDYRNGLLYLYNSRSTFGMLLFNTGDMQAYVRDLNDYYGPDINVEKALDKMKLRSAVSFININDIFSFYSVFYKYLIKSEYEQKLPFFGRGNIGFLPSLKYSLTPFGGQYGIMNYLKTNRMFSTFEMNFSDRMFGRYWNVMVSASVPKGNFRFSSLIDFWNQPQLKLEMNDDPTERALGFCFKQTVSLRRASGRIGCFGQLIHKTKGYSPGEYLSKGTFMRFGLEYYLLK